MALTNNLSEDLTLLKFMFFSNRKIKHTQCYSGKIQGSDLSKKQSCSLDVHIKTHIEIIIPMSTYEDVTNLIC